MNLAVVCGAPILLNSGLSGAVHPAGVPAALLAATAEIAAETRQRMTANRDAIQAVLDAAEREARPAPKAGGAGGGEAG